MFSNTQINVELDAKLNRKVYKKAVSNYIAQVLTDEVSSSIFNIFNNILEKNAILEHDIRSTLIKPDITHEDIVLMPKPNKDEFKDVSYYSKAMTDYNLCQKVGKLIIKQNALEHLLQNGFNKKVKAIFITLVDRQVKSNEGRVILNALVNPVARDLEHVDNYISRLYAMSILGALSEHTDLLSIEKFKVSKDGVTKYEFYAKLGFDITELQEVYDSTLNRKIMLSAPESVEDKDIYSKKKFAYSGKMNSEVAKAVNWLNEVELSIDIEPEELEALIKRKTLGKDYGVTEFTETWQQRVFAQALRQYILIMETGNRFSITRECDGVGRLYETSEFFGFMQNGLMRDRMRFADSQELTEEGKHALKLAIAAKHGYDKVLEEEAIKAFESYEQEWRKSHETYAMFNALDNGSTNLMVEIDAQTQGTQIYGLLTGDAGTCFISGLYGNDVRTDGYQMLSDKMNKYLDTTVWSRASVKSAFMVVQYSAKYKTIMFGSKYDEETGLMKGGSAKQVPLMSVSDRSDEDTWTAFQRSMYEISPKAMKIMGAIEDIAKKSKLEVVRWTMPDGFEAQVAMTQNHEEHLTWIDTTGHEHQMKHHVTTLVGGSRPTAWSPRIVQSVDAYILREVARRLEAKGIYMSAVHDAYMVHPNDVFTTMQVYREVCADVLEMNLLTDIVNQITGMKYDFQRNANVTRKDILDSKYALWF